MNYLHDKKVKRNKFLKIGIGALVLVVLIFFGSSIFGGATYGLQSIFRGVMLGGNNVSEGVSNTSSFFVSKKSLQKENEDLRGKLTEQEARMTAYDVILDENTKLKGDMGRITEGRKVVLSAILSRPNQSLYDTLVIDVGANQLIKAGDRVFAKGDVPVGAVAEVYPHSAKVVLYTSPGEKTEVVVAGADTQMTLVGRGGGNFEMVIPRDFELASGTEVHLPGITPYVVAKVKTIISDPRDSVKKALLVSPVNIQHQKFVQIETQK